MSGLFLCFSLRSGRVIPPLTFSSVISSRALLLGGTPHLFSTDELYDPEHGIWGEGANGCAEMGQFGGCEPVRFDPGPYLDMIHAAERPA